MEKEYSDEIILAAISKLKDANKPLSDLEITKGIIHRLKKKLGDDDERHSSIVRFRKNSFKGIINSLEWKKNILQIDNKKFILKEDENIHAKQKSEVAWTWENKSYEEAINFKLNNLKNINPFKLEELVARLLKFIYPDFNFLVTKKTGDKGIDVLGIQEFSSSKKEAIYVQVKRFDGTVSRKDADGFIGALYGLIKKNSYTHLTGLFITTGKYSSTFGPKLKDAQEKNISYLWWDGVELSRQMLKNGLGIKYSLDVDFWKEVDSSAILESIKIKSTKPKMNKESKVLPKSKNKSKSKL